MNRYDDIARRYDLLDRYYFSAPGRNPREALTSLLPPGPRRVLDLCCGTLANGLPAAAARPDLSIVGLDQSEGMLRIAAEKAAALGLANVSLRRGDGTATGEPDGVFDHVILGLVLHECTPGLRDALLREARRLLKPDGTLLVLEWERPRSLRRRLRFAPLYWGERLSSRDFLPFYRTEKAAWFRAHGFTAVRIVRCNYTVVLELKSA